jgi:hypothetical protein
MLAMVTAMSMVTLSLSEVRLANRAHSRAQALTAAEAGVDDTLDLLRSNLSNTGWVAPYSAASPKDLYENAANTIKFGSYYTTCVSVNGGTQRKITSVGRSGDGTRTVTLYALIEIPQIPLGDAAIKSNASVTITGTASINTTPLDQHVADVQSNQNIDLGSNGWADGALQASGTVNGTGYYPSMSGAPAQTFPDAATTNGWRNTWRTTAKTGTTYANFNGGGTITAPAYISGNIKMTNTAILQMKPSSTTDPEKNIVFVEGDVIMSGGELQNGVTLVVNGTVSLTGQATYGLLYKTVTDSVTGVQTLVPDRFSNAGKTPTVVVYNVNNESNAIKLAGGTTTDEQGVVYSVNGAIQVSGGSSFIGALVSSGTTGIVSSSGNFTMYYPIDLASPVQFPGDPKVVFVAED